MVPAPAPLRCRCCCLHPRSPDLKTLELPAYRSRDVLAQQRRHRVSELELLVAPGAEDYEVARERHQPFCLGDPEPPALPVERADPRARLPLDSRRRPIRRELEEEAPVSRTPRETWLRVPALRRPEEVVVAGRHVTQRVGVGSRDELLGFLVSLLTKNTDKMVRLFFKLGLIGEHTDVRALRVDCDDLLNRYEAIR